MGKNKKTDQSVSCPLGQSDCLIDEKLNELHQEIAKLKDQVSTDPLTGLNNVRQLRFSLEQEMERTARSHQPTCFILLDVDHFKLFNDRYGHVVGDKVLKHLASILQTAVRKIDIPCRYGGEEFAIILPSTPLLVGLQVAERIRSKVEENPLVENGEEYPMTISAGVEAYDYLQTMSIDEFIELADKQLYMAKNKGRNQVHHATKKISSSAEVSQNEKDALFKQLSDDD